VPSRACLRTDNTRELTFEFFRPAVNAQQCAWSVVASGVAGGRSGNQRLNDQSLVHAKLIECRENLRTAISDGA
jgi:hypothetical protein